MNKASKQRIGRFWAQAVVLAVCAVAAATVPKGMKILQNRTFPVGQESTVAGKPTDLGASWEPDRTDGGNRHGDQTQDHAHSGHDHSHAGHSHDDGSAGTEDADHKSNALTLSAEALRNVGLLDKQVRKIELTTFWRTITVPAQVVGRTGRTQVQVATPMTGVITHVHATQGEAVAPGTLLFRIQLTHEDLLQLQTRFLQTIGELDVEEREIKRLTAVTRSQAVPGNLLLEREYERDKLAALKNAQRESLRLHGLSDDHIETIVRDRRLIRELEVFAPTVDRHPSDQQQYQTVDYLPENTTETRQPNDTEDLLILEHLNVQKGQIVTAGTTLCVLKDYSELLIEGLVFAADLPTLRTALREKHDVTAVFNKPGANPLLIQGLQIEHLANEVDSKSRSIRFFVNLPNRILDERKRDGVRFVQWAWMIGQRAQLRVPFGHWKNQIVLPGGAVANEGSRNYVFRRHDDHFDRVAIRVRYRDPLFVVVERDGAISPGNQVAWQGAEQMQTALRCQSGGPTDAHHGHAH